MSDNLADDRHRFYGEEYAHWYEHFTHAALGHCRTVAVQVSDSQLPQRRTHRIYRFRPDEYLTL